MLNALQDDWQVENKVGWCDCCIHWAGATHLGILPSPVNENFLVWITCLYQSHWSFSIFIPMLSLFSEENKCQSQITVRWDFKPKRGLNDVLTTMLRIRRKEDILCLHTPAVPMSQKTWLVQHQSCTQCFQVDIFDRWEGLSRIWNVSLFLLAYFPPKHLIQSERIKYCPFWFA